MLFAGPRHCQSATKPVRSREGASGRSAEIEMRLQGRRAALAVLSIIVLLWKKAALIEVPLDRESHPQSHVITAYGYIFNWRNAALVVSTECDVLIAYVNFTDVFTGMTVFVW